LENCWTDEKEQKYLKEFGGNVAAVDLIKSEFITNYEMDARFAHALFLYNLQNAGAQFALDDLTINEWNWLGELKSAIVEKQNGK
jgi:hypothetical protein